MTAILTRPAWTTDLELEIFDKLLDKHAPHLPKKRLEEPRPPETEEEKREFLPFPCCWCSPRSIYCASLR
jgi:hypothetical protein